MHLALIETDGQTNRQTRWIKSGAEHGSGLLICIAL